MFENYKSFFKNLILTLVILFFSFFISLIIHNFNNGGSLIPLVFLLGVFLSSLLTPGYLYGVFAAFMSVFAVNYAFTFPFFKFNFSMPENILSAIIMLIIVLATSALTTKTKENASLKAEAEIIKTRNELLKAVSHDLRTPLTAIYGASSTIAENYDNLETKDKLQMLEGIKEESQWMIHMIENLLSASRIKNNSVEIVKSPIVLEELIDIVLSNFKKRYPKQNVELTMPEDFAIISANPILIQQVLMNLLENAVLHAENMTKLELKVTLKETEAEFKVTDNGCGMEKSRLKTIFVKDNVSQQSDSKHGMGIGLSVCASIIKAHGGKISAENNKTGGMSFCFTLKLEESVDE